VWRRCDAGLCGFRRAAIRAVQKTTVAPKIAFFLSKKQCYEKRSAARAKFVRFLACKVTLLV
jgi:hypothetical protein